MSPATKNVFQYLFNWIVYGMIPLLISGFVYGDPIGEAFVFDGHYFLWLWVFAGIFNAICDTLVHHFDNSIFNNNTLNNQFFDPSISWENKYIDQDQTKGVKKIFWFFDYPVILTDAWHLFKGCQTLCLVFGCVFAIYSGPITESFWRDLILVYGSYKWIFTVFYKFILVKNGSKN